MTVFFPSVSYVIAFKMSSLHLFFHTPEDYEVYIDVSATVELSHLIEIDFLIEKRSSEISARLRTPHLMGVNQIFILF